jgi:peptide deformylase
MGLLRAGRELRAQAVAVGRCCSTRTGLSAIQMCHEKKHLFCAVFVVRISKFAAQRRRNNFLFAPS